MMLECARTAGRATERDRSVWSTGRASKGKAIKHDPCRDRDRNRHTNAHQDQEPSAESSEINDSIPGALDEVIRAGASGADEVW